MLFSPSNLNEGDCANVVLLGFDLPIYLQIVDLIETKIINGELLPEEKLPPERQLAEMFGVNRSTVVRALDELTARAVIIRKQGSGTTVNAEKWGLFAGQSTNWRHYLTQGASHQQSLIFGKRE